MALLMIEGFETRTAKKGWNFGGSSMTTAGRFGGICAHASAQIYTLQTPTLEIVVGFARKLASTGTTLLYINTLLGSSQMRLEANAINGLELRRGSSTIVMSTPGPVADVGAWVYLEVKAKISDVGGYVKVRVNGVEVINFTGDTANTAGLDQLITQLDFASGSQNFIDDVYLCDLTGTEFNDFLGEVTIETESPNGNGAFSQFVGSDGNSVDNYLLVDELPSTDTDHVASATVGQRDTYTFTDPTQPGQILAVQVSAQISKVAAGDAYVKIIERLSNGAERVTDPFIATNLQWVNDAPHTRDPENAVWTNGSVTAAQFGVEVA